MGRNTSRTNGAEKRLIRKGMGRTLWVAASLIIGRKLNFAFRCAARAIKMNEIARRHTHGEVP